MFSSSLEGVVDMAYGVDGCEEKGVASGESPKTNGLILDALSSLRICSLSDKVSSAEYVSARAINGMTLVRLDRRFRYSMSTGLTPIRC